jgi:hypothetical protein
MVEYHPRLACNETKHTTQKAKRIEEIQCMAAHFVRVKIISFEDSFNRLRTGHHWACYLLP